MILHREGERVDEDEHEDGVLEWLRSDEPPHLVLDAVFGNVSVHEMIKINSRNDKILFDNS